MLFIELLLSDKLFEVEFICSEPADNQIDDASHHSKSTIKPHVRGGEVLGVVTLLRVKDSSIEDIDAEHQPPQECQPMEKVEHSRHIHNIINFLHGVLEADSHHPQ